MSKPSYFVDPLHFNATDSDNPYGTPERPRVTHPDFNQALGIIVNKTTSVGKTEVLLEAVTQGVAKIAAERLRQLTEEGWTAEHDDEHSSGEMALVAALYATPIKLFKQAGGPEHIVFTDAWPISWAEKWDKRFQYGSNRSKRTARRAHPHTFSLDERIDLLTKAGALIAAEIDRLLRVKNGG